MPARDYVRRARAVYLLARDLPYTGRFRSRYDVHARESYYILRSGDGGMFGVTAGQFQRLCLHLLLLFVRCLFRRVVAKGEFIF